MEKHFLVFFLVLSLVIVEPAEAFSSMERWHIHVVNGLTNAQTLLVHCKSKDNDLGEHDLNGGTEYNWTFRVNFWDTTLFWCYLQKPDGKSSSFEAFWVEKSTIWLVYKCSGNNCIWIAKDDGIYLKDNEAQKDILLHEWK